ncbi:HTH-type transcriptional regulator LeuO [Sinobacterium norvegicum]|uniref:HTH-type transcriptional regulator LeuO n=1 Tax=Sinobacterium norvegicum TaxID=1641715 RepID=A0ABM9AEV3_9GAMM|nr:LysR family transcriptional regulator [Sinobacterium norvegicum]CAH0991239.1 HTH-type transcriptional regulator LeuO [Sinobacterium norvegicum]
MLTNRVDLNLLTTFLEVYRLNSITLAAEALDTTQPTVSGILKRLSEQLGEQLFVREGRGIAPTSVAVQLAADIGPAFIGIDNALDNLKSFDIDHPRRFNVFVTEPMMLLLQPLVKADKTMGQCQINFQLAPPTLDKLFEKLGSQQIDLAVDLGRLDHPSYQSQLFHRDQLLVTCRQNHSQYQDRLTIDQYYSADHVRLKLRRSGLDGVTMLSKAPMRSRNITAVCDSVMSGLALASTSEVLCLAPKSIAEVYAPLLNLQALPLPFATHPLEHYLHWHNRTTDSQAHRWLRQKIVSLLDDCVAG